MSQEKAGRRINWYRSPIDREVLRQLSQRSNLKGAMQAGGYLGLYGLTLGMALYGWGRWHWAWIAGVVFVHGMIAAFMINGVHELGHGTVFRTRWLNERFEETLAFLGWINYRYFDVSHLRHHAYTLHPPDDLEVVLPMRLMIGHCLKYGIVNPMGIVNAVRDAWRRGSGKFESEWDKTLFPLAAKEKARPVIRWARFMLVGHAVITLGGLALAVWVSPGFVLIPLMVSSGNCYGQWLFWLCNNTQHVGLQDNVADFRLNSRTYLLHPVPRFLFWQMNYHIEHHMYPTVPCYRLKALREAIKHDLPPAAKGLVQVWREITEILEKQRVDPTYQHRAAIPAVEGTAVAR